MQAPWNVAKYGLSADNNGNFLLLTNHWFVFISMHCDFVPHNWYI